MHYSVIINFSISMAHLWIVDCMVILVQTVVTYNLIADKPVHFILAEKIYVTKSN